MREFMFVTFIALPTLAICAFAVIDFIECRKREKRIAECDEWTER